MPKQNLILEEKLKNIWLSAARGQQVDFDFTGDPRGRSKAYRARNALYNFRRKVRVNKLNPEYDNLWAEISLAELRVISMTHLRLQLSYRTLSNFTKAEVYKVKTYETALDEILDKNVSDI